MDITSKPSHQQQLSSLTRFENETVALHKNDSLAINSSQSLTNDNNTILKSTQGRASGQVSASKTATENNTNSKLGERAVAFLKGEEGVIFLSADKLDKMSAVLQRLDEKQQNALIDSSIISNEDFLSLAEKLDDRQVRQFADVAAALKVPAQRNHIPDIQMTGFKVRSLVETLNNLDTKILTQVLDRIELEASKVAMPQSSDSYDKSAVFVAPSRSANDLNNFLHFINKSEDVGASLDDLTHFNELQQSDLLAVMVGTGLGEKLVEQLANQPDHLKTDLLAFMAKTVSNVSAYVLEMGRGAEGKVGTHLDHDDLSSKTAGTMVDQTLSLMENYDFSVEQLDDMASSLNSLSVSEQRAYLNISVSGFELLVGEGKGAENKVSLEGAQPAIEAIDKVRDNYQARDVVYKSRMGEGDAGGFFELKNAFQANTDQQDMAELLVADAYFSLVNQDAINPVQKKEESANQYTEHTNKLASNLLQLNADQRDKLSASLSGMIDSKAPLASLDDESLVNVLAPFYQRSASLAKTQNIEELYAIKQQIVEDKVSTEDSFWQASHSAGKSLDEFVQILKIQSSENQQEMIEFFVKNDTNNTDSLAKKGQMDVNKRDFFASYY
jgi:hypothetical protein